MAATKLLALAGGVAAGTAALVRLQRRGGALGRTAGCQTVEVDLGSPRRLRFDYFCDGERVGHIEAAKTKVAGKVRWAVRDVRVQRGHRRQRIGTRLYERAAKEACRRGAPLASDERIGEASTPFWEKQIRKGRAHILSLRGGRGGEEVYELSCPAPRSLARVGS